MTLEIVPFAAESALNWHALTDALEAGHRLPRAEVGDSFLYRGPDTLLNRAAWIDGLGQLVKCATIFPGNGAHNAATINGSVTLYADQTGMLEALVDFHLVTKWKTAGDSLLAAKKLARPDSRKILLVGAGTVAASMIEAYSSTFTKPEFTVWSRNPVSTAAFAQAHNITAATDLETAVKAADIICTATMSKTPLIMGDWLQPGQHLDLIGAFRPDMREVDDTAIARARLFVDARATTLHHIGEIMMPIASGAITESHIIADFYDLAKGSYDRRTPDDITIAKNGGGAHLDLMTATYILHAWRNR
ncbi:ornithine cyclodeaminase [Pseudorhodobacter antarcticus]|jgi:ornithine cyclodeaminase|uniref:Ornithine cyclodeaminase n=1 Tax=Pseudorhodobacter antarcticus TaxID=1077947 RepID=A0A1H8FNB1_9RHOB|nr:NAD(P)-binding domain-containing protein [Pseudorhodobacter antarcticus]SEN33183.1 ornithine cyclodeaminase [Pseudorhodobacter antarcticus]